MNRQPRTIGILETTGFTPAIVALDAMEKGFQISVLQAELNDMLGVCIKILGDVSQVNTALETGRRVADRLKGSPVATTLPLCEAGTFKVLNALPEYNPLIQQDVVHIPKGNSNMVETKETIAALGFIETQGFTAVFDAIDTACKSANVEVVGKEKLGGGYVTVIVKGDVAAVNTAVATGSQKVEALGNLVAAHVVTRPSPAVLCLLP